MAQAVVIPEWVVAITCPRCYGVGFECKCPLFGHGPCTEAEPCDDCFDNLMREAEEKAGWYRP
jgi:hypothetical protein